MGESRSFPVKNPTTVFVMGNNSSPNLDSKYITENGTYYASNDGLDGFSYVDVQIQSGSANLTTYSTMYPKSGVVYASNNGYDGYSQIYNGFGFELLDPAVYIPFYDTCSEQTEYYSRGMLYAIYSSTSSLYLDSGTKKVVSNVKENSMEQNSLEALYVNNTANWFDMEFDRFSFSNFYSLTDIYLEGGHIKLGYKSFHDCTNLSNAVLGGSGAYGVYDIGESCFYGCSSLASVTLGYCLRHIGVEAFAYCNIALTELVYEGTCNDFMNEVEVDTNWNLYSNIDSIQCYDGYLDVDSGGNVTLREEPEDEEPEEDPE